MNGLIVINKPINYTSRDVVNKLTSFFGTKKIGHTGTLDPLATGVLVCLVGKYTHLVADITALDKEYIAEIKLGEKTDTGDITGKVIAEKSFSLNKEDILKTFQKFIGSYNQEVPLYSAVKISGKKLYEYARENKEVILPKRKVTIYNIELLAYQDGIIKFKTKVSKGTYIRSLINDLCTDLKTVGTMQSLIRTKQGNFALEDAYSLEDVLNNSYHLQNIKEFLDYPIIELDDIYFKKVDNGMAIPNTFKIKDKVIFTYQGKDVVIYKEEKNKLKSYLKF